MDVKSCNLCGQSKPLEAFPPYKGKRRSYCRECKRAREAAPEYKAQRNSRRRERIATIPAVKEARAAQMAAYGRSAKGKAAQARYWQHYRVVSRDKVLARRAVNKAVLRGKIAHPTTLSCVRCGAPARAYHHHLGYDLEHRLAVVPVCIPCHHLEHR